ncbi:MAG: hypothetical protein KI793_30055 [Rivularia sp. (in: Bacteria)]|nr:hypothetical protein [Rivularia sp. MS3]
MLNKDLYELMRSLANYESFISCTALSDRLYEEQYDMELVLRFILLFDKEEEYLKKFRGDVSNYLTDEMREMARNKKFDYSHIEKAFKQTFDILNQALGDDSFKRYISERDEFVGGFYLPAYEIIALGIAYHYQNPLQTNEISSRIKNIWSDRTYRQWSLMGRNNTRSFSRVIPLGRKEFSPQ